MVPDARRREVLLATGVVVATTAGCTIRRIEDTERAQGATTRAGGDAGGTDGAEDGGDDGGGAGGTGTTGSEADGNDADTGVDGGTYGFLVRNEISVEDLDPYPPIDGRPPAEISLTVEARPEDEEAASVIFDREFEMPPESTRRFEEAFTASRDETAYVISLSLGEFERYDEFEHSAEYHSAGYRFTTGGFGVPEDSTFLVTIRDIREAPDSFEARMTMTNPDNWDE
jgi:hypothetical protein